jgi:hypothetical protein
MEHNRFDEMDRIIDAGLAGYAAHEPLAGLEDRVLNRVRLANAGRRRSRYAYWGLAAAAVGALMVVAVMPRSSHAPAAKPVETKQVRTFPPHPAAPLTHAAVPRRQPKHKTALPKREQFPTPTPLTPEERALIAVAQLPPADLEALAGMQTSSEEIRIAPIEIPPLQIDGN